jgi:TetR/AcrR family transcriptional regulator, repressor for neighboring sulfatase
MSVHKARAGDQDGPDRGRVPGTRRHPSCRKEVREALLDAAQKLIAARGPARVTLREIADEAGVNFGLVYQYLGTRDELLREVYQRVTQRSATRFEPIEKLPDAVAAMMSVPDDSIARIMAWAILDGDYPADVFGRSPALEHIAEVIAGHRNGGRPSEPREDERLMAAFLLVTMLGWRLFQSIGLTSAGLDPAADPDRDRIVTGWIERLASSGANLSTPGPTTTRPTAPGKAPPGKTPPGRSIGT